MEPKSPPPTPLSLEVSQDFLSHFDKDNLKQAEVEIDTDSPPPPLSLWNPSVAAIWSLLLTPAFGAYIQALNWQTLGREDKVRTSMVWVYLSLAIVALMPLFYFLYGKDPQVEALNKALNVGYLLVWYFLHAQEQIKFIVVEFEGEYKKKPWGTALCYGLGTLFIFILFATLVLGLVFSWIK